MEWSLHPATLLHATVGSSPAALPGPTPRGLSAGFRHLSAGRARPGRGQRGWGKCELALPASHGDLAPRGPGRGPAPPGHPCHLSSMMYGGDSSGRVSLPRTLTALGTPLACHPPPLGTPSLQTLWTPLGHLNLTHTLPPFSPIARTVRSTPRLSSPSFFGRRRPAGRQCAVRVCSTGLPILRAAGGIGYQSIGPPVHYLP